jgi:hypothetical protein
MTQNTLKKLSLSFAATAILFASCDTTSQKTNSVPAELKNDIAFLASDSLEGRETGTEGEAKAAVFLAERFEKLGLKPAGEDDSFFQQFSFKPHPPITKHDMGDTTMLGTGYVKERTGRNVVAMLDKGAEQTIIIGAHYDHLGYGDENSLFTGGKAIHNGADDNASGVAAMLELADRFKDVKLSSNLVFIAFSGEEKGLYGSNYFVDNPTINLDQVNYMINMDMVGRMKADSTLAVYGTGTSPSWPEAVNMTNTDSLNLVFHESGVGPSDHTSFYLADLPVLHFFTGQHEDYHKPTDDPDKINYEGMMLVIDFIERIVLELDDDGKLVFTKTKDQDNDSSPRFKVTLGVVPDYLFDGKGMRIDGVSEERPAHTAGIIAGDVVVKMGEHDVNDMQGYMEGLSMFEAGDTTAVTVIRNGDEKTFDVVWD